MVSPMPPTGLNAIRVNESDQLGQLTSPGTQLALTALTDGDHYIIVNLEYDEAEAAFTNAGQSEIVFHKPQMIPHNLHNNNPAQLFQNGTATRLVDYSEEEGAIPITYECASGGGGGETENVFQQAFGMQMRLDDEQARAVANLLEFHNQQTVTVSNNGFSTTTSETDATTLLSTTSRSDLSASTFTLGIDMTGDSHVYGKPAKLYNNKCKKTFERHGNSSISKAAFHDQQPPLTCHMKTYSRTKAEKFSQKETATAILTSTAFLKKDVKPYVVFPTGRMAREFWYYLLFVAKVSSLRLFIMIFMQLLFFFAQLQRNLPPVKRDDCLPMS
jgi:hypothetical protein